MPRSIVFFFLMVGLIAGVILHSNMFCIIAAYVIITVLAIIEGKIEQSLKSFFYAWLSGIVSYTALIAWLGLFDYLQSIS